MISERGRDEKWLIIFEYLYYLFFLPIQVLHILYAKPELMSNVFRMTSQCVLPNRGGEGNYAQHPN